jgi:hypothetical protein
LLIIRVTQRLVYEDSTRFLYFKAVCSYPQRISTLGFTVFSDLSRYHGNLSDGRRVFDHCVVGAARHECTNENPAISSTSACTPCSGSDGAVTIAFDYQISSKKVMYTLRRSFG